MPSSTFNALALFCVLYLFLIQSTYSQFVNNPCTMPSGAAGICRISIHDCDIWAIQKEGITKCGPGEQNLICCPTTQPIRSQSVEEAAEDSPCTLNSGATGVCKPSVHDCDLFELGKEGSTTTCGTASNKMICCPMKKSISSQKCTEYYRKKCVKVTQRYLPARTIYNGEIVTSVEEFPHMALLGYDTGRGVAWTCGGTLISEQYVLTAAHCLTYSRAPVSLVNLGFLNRNNTNVSTLQQFRVIERVKHPNRTVSQWYNDLALLKLDRPVQMTDAVFPACLHEDAGIPGTAVQAVGWGITEDSTLSDELRKATLPLIDQNECNQEFLSERKLPRGILEESQFCAGGNNRDTCNGDSGGPALIRHKNGCLHSVVGVTSLGVNCDVNLGRSPSPFTRVSHYVPWIESIVWPVQ